MATPEQNRTSAWAGRHKDMIPDRFETVGFKPGESMSLARAMTMVGINRRLMEACKPTPSVTD